MSQVILLVNTNVVRPPVSPVGLEYVGQALIDAGIPVQVLDLSFEADWKASLRKQLGSDEPLAVGVGVRNTDDCSFISRKSFLPWVSSVVSELKKLTAAPVFLGGGGFSTMPEAVLLATGAEAGIEGDGEEALASLARALAGGEAITGLPGLVYRRGEKVVRNPRADVDLRRLPAPRRRLFDNRRYEQAGAMVGVETKRGCSQGCIFCADPVARGNRMRLRPPQMVVHELQDLVDQGVSWFHLCDSEFNLPVGHAREVCQAIIGAGLKDRVRWYCYCSPVPFDRELDGLMKAAGCAGINFGVDSLCDEQLRRLGKSYLVADVARLVAVLRRQGLNYIFDLLAGAPGETPGTLRATVEKVREMDVPLVGIAAGVRVYPHTPLEEAVVSGAVRDGLYPAVSQAPGEPLFYLSPALGDDATALIDRLVGDDPRFLVLSRPSEKGSYNYAGDEALGRLIEQGARGAYWDILRQSMAKRT
ncbi:MAG: radical SAM protein [Chloroflexi bacterium]|nr:radical SAM protein [Chloroflexota bacterium]